MSNNLHYWIQRHDYSVIEREDVPSSGAKRAFRTFDWRAELEKYDEDDPEGNCPPGFGVNNGLDLEEPGAMLLHICPIDEHTVFLNIHFTFEGKILGVIPVIKSPVNYVNPFDRSKVDHLIDLIYAGNREALLAVR